MALVVACGIPVSSVAAHTGSILLCRDNYYQRFRFADVFVSLKRAPNAAMKAIDAIAGRRAEARVVVDVTLDVPGLPSRRPVGSFPSRRGRNPFSTDLIIRGRYSTRIGGTKFSSAVRSRRQTVSRTGSPPFWTRTMGVASASRASRSRRSTSTRSGEGRFCPTTAGSGFCG